MLSLTGNARPNYENYPERNPGVQNYPKRALSRKVEERMGISDTDKLVAELLYMGDAEKMREDVESIRAEASPFERLSKAISGNAITSSLPLAAGTLVGPNSPVWKYVPKNIQFKLPGENKLAAEISDQGFTTHLKRGTQDLWDAVTHRLLRGFYPTQLDDIKVQFRPDRYGAGAEWDTKNRVISVFEPPGKAADQALGHELLGHVIDTTEGRELPMETIKKYWDPVAREYAEEFGKIIDDKGGLRGSPAWKAVMKKITSGEETYNTIWKYPVMEQYINRKEIWDSPFGEYMRMIHEIRARDAAARMHLSDAERARTPIYDSQSIPYNRILYK